MHVKLGRLHHTLVVISAATIAACGTASTGPRETPAEDDPGPPATFAVSGVVRDSLTGADIESAMVTIAGRSATTDFAGSYTVTEIPGGIQSIEVRSGKHRLFEATVDVSRDVTFNVRLWRLAPFLEQVVFFSDRTVDFHWLDLDGDFPDRACALFRGPGFTSVGCSLSYTDPSPIQRVYTIPGDFNATEVETSLRDLAGNLAEFYCTFSCSEVTS